MPDRPIRPRPARRLHLYAPRGRVKARVICRDCGQECLREAFGFECACGFGFTVQWDACVARGVFLGRIQFPEIKEMVA